MRSVLCFIVSYTPTWKESMKMRSPETIAIESKLRIVRCGRRQRFRKARKKIIAGSRKPGRSRSWTWVLQIGKREEIVRQAGVEASVGRLDAGPLPGTIERMHGHDDGIDSSTENTDVVRRHASHRLAVLIEVGLFEHDEIVTNPDGDLPPNDGRTGLRDRVDDPHLVAGLLFAPRKTVRVFGEKVIGFGQIVIGKVRTHPGLAHHAGRKPDDLLELRIENPGLVSKLERCISRVCVRGREAHERIAHAARPGFHCEMSLPAGAMNCHSDGGLRAFGAVIVEDALQECFDIRRGRGYRG